MICFNQKWSVLSSLCQLLGQSNEWLDLWCCKNSWCRRRSGASWTGGGGGVCVCVCVLHKLELVIFSVKHWRNECEAFRGSFLSNPISVLELFYIRKGQGKYLCGKNITKIAISSLNNAEKRRRKNTFTHKQFERNNRYILFWFIKIIICQFELICICEYALNQVCNYKETFNINSVLVL